MADKKQEPPKINDILDAIEYAKAREVVLPEVFYGLLAQYQQLAFTVMGLAAIAQIEAVAVSLNAAIESGRSWDGWANEAVQKRWVLSKAHADTIIRTNAQVAYNAGHWRSFEQNKNIYPYLMYSSIRDTRTRPSHLKLNGVVLPVNDPYWHTHSPPLGFNCRCALINLSKKEYDKMAENGSIVDPPDVEPDSKGFGRVPTIDDMIAMMEKMAKERKKAAGV